MTGSEGQDMPAGGAEAGIKPPWKLSPMPLTIMLPPGVDAAERPPAPASKGSWPPICTADDANAGGVGWGGMGWRCECTDIRICEAKDEYG
jgi:hypothetical protein